jgi:hypothetical protein
VDSAARQKQDHDCAKGHRTSLVQATATWLSLDHLWLPSDKLHNEKSRRRFVASPWGGFS